MGSIKDRNGMDLTEAEGIKKRWQEYTEELYRKYLQDPDNYSGVISYLEPDILYAGRDLGREEKGTTEDEMAGWNHRLDGHGFG